MDNLAYLDESGQLVQNPLSQLPFDLDRMPFPDYDLGDHFVLDRGVVGPANLDNYERHHTTYFVITTRGCPFVCSYCHQSELVTTYPNKQYRSRSLRYKSVERTLEELAVQLDRLPFCKNVGFSDDDFFCRKLDEIQDFSRGYARRIGRPFGVGTIPLSIRPEKLEPLLDAGLAQIQIGIQSGSDRVNRDVYKRLHPKHKLLEALELLDRYHQRYDFGVDVDWIIDCPWENEDDVADSLALSFQIPRWMKAHLCSLTYYPGTVLWTQAVAEGVISASNDVYEQTAHRLRTTGHSYLTHVLIAQNTWAKRFPRAVTNLMASRPARLLGERLPRRLMNRAWEALSPSSTRHPF